MPCVHHSGDGRAGRQQGRRPVGHAGAYVVVWMVVCQSDQEGVLMDDDDEDDEEVVQGPVMDYETNLRAELETKRFIKKHGEEGSMDGCVRGQGRSVAFGDEESHRRPRSGAK